MKQTLVIIFLIIANLFTASSQVPKKKLTGKKVIDNYSVFKNIQPFNRDSYTGGMNIISTPDNNTASIALYIKDGDDFRAYAQLEIKGDVLLGTDGVLAYPETFLRIKFVKGDWEDIGRKAIKNGLLFIETKGVKKLFTIYGFSASQYTALIRPGIHAEL